MHDSGINVVSARLCWTMCASCVAGPMIDDSYPHSRGVDREYAVKPKPKVGEVVEREIVNSASKYILQRSIRLLEA